MQKSPYALIFAYAGLVLGQLMWAGNTVIVRAAAGEVPPIALSFWRWLITIVILAPITVRYMRADWPLIRRNLGRLMVLAFSGVATYNTVLYIALQISTAINVTLLHQLLPVATVLLAWPILQRAPSGRQVCGMSLSFTGVVIIVSKGALAVMLSLSFNRGDLLIVVGTINWALYSVLLNRYRIDIHPLSLILVMSLIALPLLFPFYLLELRDIGPFALTAPNIGVVCYTAIFASILALLVWNHGVAAVGAQTAAMFGYFHPLFTIVLAVAFLGERLQSFHYLGGTLILGGVYFAITGARSFTAMAPDRGAADAGARDAA